MSRLGSYGSPPLQALADELDKTGAISESYKRLLINMAMECRREGYEAGKDAQASIHDVQADTEAELWVHGLPAASFHQVANFLEGDAHDRSKVQVRIAPKGAFGRFFDVKLKGGANV